jgi:hypothetical protein
MEKSIKHIPYKRNLLIEKKGHKSFLATKNTYLFKIEDTSQKIKYYKCLIPNLSEVFKVKKEYNFYRSILGRSSFNRPPKKELSIETYYDRDENTLKDFAIFFKYFLDYLNKSVSREPEPFNKFSCTIMSFDSSGNYDKIIKINGCTMVHIRTNNQKLSNSFDISFESFIETKAN